MALNATSPAANSESPLARSFHTSTIAMQRANPTNMTPTIISGLSGSRIIAKINITKGPTIQFCTSDRTNKRMLRKTLGSCS